ncbi:MAG: TonB-dependent receptor plug domain-containing protein [Alphaproteobacteria bacterium]
MRERSLLAVSGQALAATATEIVITGSRIPQKNLITTSPVVTIGSADVNTQGITKVEDLTNNLPQVFAGQNATVSNGSNATATVDLRGLGARHRAASVRSWTASAYPTAARPRARPPT